MSSNPPAARARGQIEARGGAVLAAVGAWTIVVPYLGKALGLSVPVAGRIEVVDHVIPGALVVAAGLYLSSIARRGRLASWRSALLASGAALLAGFWVVATHVPLVQDAATTEQPWDAAIWHSIAGLPILLLAAWLVLRSTQDL